jgi:hypothetical protein
MAETEVRAEYQKFDNGRPKFSLMWTNHQKHFYIDGVEVTEEKWIKEMEENNEK